MHWTLHHCISRDDHHDDGSGGDGDYLMLPTHIWSDGLPNALHPVAWNKNNFTNSSRVLSAIIAYHVSNLCSKMEQERHLVLILKSFLQNAPRSSPSAVGWQVSDPPALSTTFNFIGLPFAVHQSKRSSPTFRGLRCHHSHHIFNSILISVWKVSDSGTLRPLWVHLIQSCPVSGFNSNTIMITRMMMMKQTYFDENFYFFRFYSANKQIKRRWPAVLAKANLKLESDTLPTNAQLQKFKCNELVFCI